MTDSRATTTTKPTNTTIQRPTKAKLPIILYDNDIVVEYDNTIQSNIKPNQEIENQLEEVNPEEQTYIFSSLIGTNIECMDTFMFIIEMVKMSKAMSWGKTNRIKYTII